MENKVQHIRIRAAGILVKDDRILLVRHEKNGKSYWLLPGGGVDFGESVAEGLRREFQEEVGLDIQVGPMVLVHDSIPPNHHRQVLNIYFMVSTDRYELKVTPDAVLRDAAFYPLTEFQGMPVNPDVKAEILEGLKTGWAKGCLYIGNQWKD
ncbi:MAG TPA: NUDIX hydrolase [bacterium]|nr:NUDIX hydrolase [bacterium]